MIPRTENLCVCELYFSKGCMYMPASSATSVQPWVFRSLQLCLSSMKLRIRSCLDYSTESPVLFLSVSLLLTRDTTDLRRLLRRRRRVRALLNVIDITILRGGIRASARALGSKSNCIGTTRKEVPVRSSGYIKLS